MHTSQLLRVGHICQDFSPLSETFIYDYVVELERRGCTGHVMAANLHNRDSRPFDRVYHTPWPGPRHPCRLVHRVLAEAGVGDRRNASWPEYRRRVGKAIRHIGPDVLHAHFGTVGAVTWPLAKRAKIPMVVSLHGKDAFVHPTSDRYRKAYAQMFEHVGAVTVVSRLMGAHIEKLGADPAKVHLIRVGKEVETYPYRRPEADRVQEWVSVGRLTEKKGHRDTIAAFAEVVVDHPDQRLKIVGEGELYEPLRCLIQERGLDEHVQLLGSVDHDGVKQLMERADAFVLNSRTAEDGDREGVPTVLMEAQLLGLPCVSTTHSGIPEVIPERNRWLLSSEGDVAAIAESMRKLIAAGPAERADIAEAGRAKVEAEFNLRLEVQKLTALYESLVERE